MLRHLLPILIVTGATLAAQPGSATAGSIKDCEKIQAADAYNQCLAAFGPVAHEHDLKPVPVGLGSGRLYHLRRHHHYYRAHYRHGHGIAVGHRDSRKSIQLSVEPGGAED